MAVVQRPEVNVDSSELKLSNNELKRQLKKINKNVYNTYRAHAKCV